MHKTKPKKQAKKIVTKKRFIIRKRYLFLSMIAFLITVNIFDGKDKVVMIPRAIFYGESFMKENFSQTKLSSTNNIELPVQKDSATDNVGIFAPGYISIDRATMTPLLQKNANKKVEIASITKLMTAVITLENAKLDEIVAISGSFPNAPAGRMGLYVGEKITIENILSGLLISSSNDAAEALAMHIGKGSYRSFLQMMNVKAKEIGMTNTNFNNAMGLDDRDNYSTPQDLVYLANYALNDEFIAKTVRTQELTVESMDGFTKHKLNTTDELLKDKDIEFLGLKTGSTPGAGECLLSFAKTKDGHEILTAVLGSGDRFGETKKMVQWVEENIEWR